MAIVCCFSADLKGKVPGEVLTEFKQEIARVVQNPNLLESVSTVSTRDFMSDSISLTFGFRR